MYTRGEREPDYTIPVNWNSLRSASIGCRLHVQIYPLHSRPTRYSCHSHVGAPFSLRYAQGLKPTTFSGHHCVERDLHFGGIRIHRYRRWIQELFSMIVIEIYFLFPIFFPRYLSILISNDFLVILENNIRLNPFQSHLKKKRKGGKK